MSKFVTYPAVTVLDNDQSLLIDSPSAGTNSITAENAGNTLLSKWAGFETFDEAVQNTIENNQEFIDRDATIRSETAELKKKIVTTFPAKDASGAVATFESEFEDAPLKSCVVQVNPVQDLHGYDHPWPGGGGKNLFDSTLLKDQASWNIIPLKVKPDTVYTMSTDKSSNELYLYFNNVEKGGGGSSKAVHVNQPVTITSTSDGYVYISQRRVSGDDSFQNYHFQVEEGSTATNWTPYENICPISGWTGCEVQRTRKNLLNLVESEMVSNGWNRIFPISLKVGTYIISCQNQFGASTKGAAVALVDDNATTVIKWLSGYEFGDSTFVGRATIITEEEASKIKNIRFSLRASGATYNDIVQGNIQLEHGSTATSYEPYTGQTYPITFPIEAGTVYGGYIDPINGELIPQIELITLDGVVNKMTGVFGTTNEGNTCLFSTNIGLRTQYDNKSISNVFKVEPSLSYNRMPLYSFFGGSGSSRTISFVFPPNTTVEDANAWLAEQLANGTPVVVTRHIAEPIHYPLTPTEIKTLLGTNNIWSNTGDTTVEYLMSDVSWYVKKKLRAFQSILAGVEDSTSASKNYSANTYLIFNDNIYKTTKTITAGETIEEGVNVTKTTVAEQLMALAQA